MSSPYDFILYKTDHTTWLSLQEAISQKVVFIRKIYTQFSVSMLGVLGWVHHRSSLDPAPWAS